MSRLVKIRRTVRSRLGIPVTDQLQSDDVIDEHINIAIQTIEEEYRWPWQEAIQNITVNDTTGDVPVPTSWKATRVVMCEYHEVGLVTPVEVLMCSTNEHGLPSIFTVIDRTLKFRPIPPVGTALQHIYYRTPDLLVGDDDEPQMPTEYTPAIVAKAAELLSLREGDRASAASHAAEYAQWVGRMRKAIRRTTGPIVPRVRPDGWV